MIEITYITNKGLQRQKNEDAILVDDLIIQEDNMEIPMSIKYNNESLILSVADGLGGHGYGEVASRLTLEVILNYKPTNESEITSVLRQAHHKLINYATSNPQYFGFGTCIAGVIINGNDITIFNVGDCRVYKYSNKKLQKLTRDHSYVQELIDKGIITDEESIYHPHRNIVLESIGGIMDYRFIDVRTYRKTYEDNDIYMICSDGLFDMLQEDEMKACFSDDLQNCLLNLFKRTFEKGAKDNVSIVLFRILNN